MERAVPASMSVVSQRDRQDRLRQKLLLQELTQRVADSEPISRGRKLWKALIEPFLIWTLSPLLMGLRGCGYSKRAVGESVALPLSPDEMRFKLSAPYPLRTPAGLSKPNAGSSRARS